VCRRCDPSMSARGSLSGGRDALPLRRCPPARRGSVAICCLLLSAMAVLAIPGCRSEKPSGGETPAPAAEKRIAPPPSRAEPPSPSIDLAAARPNEAGTIMIVMFHSFVRAFTPTKDDAGEFTTTFDDFRRLLSKLYGRGYRLIGVNDYLSNDISVPLGLMPVMFTFDDVTAGQFNLILRDGALVASPESAVGIMEAFAARHADFGLEATFYVNTGLETFPGAGTQSERLRYLVEKGFELGNHTLRHARLDEIRSERALSRAVGGNQKRMLELVPGYRFRSLALPFGREARGMAARVASGEYEGIAYENLGVMGVGWKPAPAPASREFDPLSIPRVRASGMKPVVSDCAWWLRSLSREEQYVSDGDPGAVTVPKEEEATVDPGKLRGKRLVIY
jgi:hypothetical protein